MIAFLGWCVLTYVVIQFVGGAILERLHEE